MPSDPVPHYSMLTRAYSTCRTLTALAAYAVTNTGCKACEPTLPIEMTAGGTEDPVDPVPPSTVPTSGDVTGEPPPTGGPELCPGYNDVCIFDSPDQTRTIF